MVIKYLLIFWCFNSRSREGSDGNLNALSQSLFMSFNSRSREGSDYTTPQIRLHLASFNSRSREGSDKSEIKKINASIFVSTRAPAKGATQNDDKLCQAWNSFNSRSREGSDGDLGPDERDSMIRFNSRSREGSD